jgi:hypothetical protein
MFWKTDYSNFTKAAELRLENAELQNKVVQLESDVERTVRELESVRKELAEFKASIDNESRNASVVIDFKNMDVFSIERITKDDVPHTIIGHWVYSDAEGDAGKRSSEWILYCSLNIHEQLVKDFKESKNS